MLIYARRLRSVWLSLDPAGVGYVNAGEFGRFMRLGEHAIRDAENAKRGTRQRGGTIAPWDELRDELLHNKSWYKVLDDKARAEPPAHVRLTYAQHSYSILTFIIYSRTRQALADPANDDEMDALADQLAGRMRKMYPERVNAGPYWLFKSNDVDGSGRVSFPQLKKAVQRQLDLTEDELPEQQLRAAWRSLDGSGTGYLHAGEFMRWMRRAEAPGAAEEIEVPYRTPKIVEVSAEIPPRF